MTRIWQFCFRVILVALCYVPLAQAASADAAKDYPNRPIRMLVAQAPGSGVDTVSRIISVRLGELLGQQIVVDNRPGAGGVLGMEISARAAPDGYTLIAAATSTMSIAPHLRRNLAYDPLASFDFISLCAVTPNVLVVNPALPVKNLKEFIDYAKARGGKLNMASAGIGSQSQLSAVMFMLAAGIDSLHVPYKGGAATVGAVMSNESQWLLSPAAAVIALARSGQLKALGHTLPQRSALFPDVPPIHETVPGFSYSGWIGLVAPKGTPKLILEKVHRALIAAVNTPQVKDALTAQAAEVVTNTPAEFRKFVQQELAATGEAVKAAGVKAE